MGPGKYKTGATVSLQVDTVFAPYPAPELETALAWAHGSGFDAAELVVARPGEVDAASLRRQLERHGLRVPTLATGQAFGLEGLSLSSPDCRAREKTVQRVNEHIILAAELGAPCVTVGLIQGRPDDREEGLGRLRGSISKCLTLAEDKGVCLVIEAINRYEASLINSTEDAARFIGSMGSPAGIGILYDTFHSNIEDADMPQAIREHGGLIRHVHLADSNRRLPGGGHIPFRGIIQALDDMGYDGYYSLEVLNMPDRQAVIQRAGGSLKEVLQI